MGGLLALRPSSNGRLKHAWYDRWSLLECASDAGGHHMKMWMGNMSRPSCRPYTTSLEWIAEDRHVKSHDLCSSLSGIVHRIGIFLGLLL